MKTELEKLEQKIKEIKLKEKIEKNKGDEKIVGKKNKGLKWFDNLFKEKKFKKPNMVAVVYLRNNGTAEPMEMQTKNGFFNINSRTYHERKDCTYILNIKNNRLPLAIIPEWSMTPLGTKRWNEQEMHEKFNEFQDHTLRAIRHAEIVRRTGGIEGFDTKKAVGLVILAIIVLAVVMNLT